LASSWGLNSSTLLITCSTTTRTRSNAACSEQTPHGYRHTDEALDKLAADAGKPGEVGLVDPLRE
jgi:hypothetical protein